MQQNGKHHNLQSYSNINHSWHQLKSIQWKNKRACGREAYCPTQIEHVANVLTHGIWVLPSIWGWIMLMRRAVTLTQFIAALIYGAALVSLFLVSTCFHSVFYCNKNKHLKDLLHRCDRAMIYVFIAGSYFPWLTVVSIPTRAIWTSTMQWLVWCLAGIGITYQQIFHERYKSFETCLYLIMGISPALPMFYEISDLKGIDELKIGGIIYVLGVIFFKADGSIPCAHAIWHLFVVIAAGVHYFAVLNNLFPDPEAHSTVPNILTVNSDNLF